MARTPRSEAGSKGLHPKGAAKRKAAKPKATAPKSAESDAKRQANGRFGKGNRANPGGRPKDTAEIRDLARQYTVEAIERLAQVMRSDNERAAVAAVNVLLDRGWGKAMQSVEMTGKDGAPLVPMMNVVYGSAVNRPQPAR